MSHDVEKLLFTQVDEKYFPNKVLNLLRENAWFVSTMQNREFFVPVFKLEEIIKNFSDNSHEKIFTTSLFKDLENYQYIHVTT